MSKEAQLIKYFVQDLQQDCQSYAGLLELLKSLNSAILSRHVETISSLNATISETAIKLHESSLRREKILQALKLTPNRTGAEALIAKLPASLGDSARTWWNEVNLHILACQQQNQANGKLMAMHQEIITQLLNPAESAGVYNPSYY